jgi:hypothetical protein
VLLKIAGVFTCRVLSLAVLAFRGDPAKDAGLLVLRHENAALRRHEALRFRRLTVGRFVNLMTFTGFLEMISSSKTGLD